MIKKIDKNTNASRVWNIIGSFGNLDGEITATDSEVYYSDKDVFVKSEYEKYKNGITIQKGFVRNDGQSEIKISTLSSKFMFDGGEYEVYTQSNFWQNESRGGWNNLISQVCVEGKGVRNCSGAVPFIALWNKQTGRGYVFHLITYSTWQMKVKFAGKTDARAEIELEAGVNTEGLSMVLSPGEEMEIPQIIYYEIRNKTDLDAYKLHDYMNEAYKRREMPVIYNTWLYRFDRINYENVLSQIDRAKELGVEYFVIDAGWFGEGINWYECRGDYEENLTFGFKGRMSEIADKVRENGMKFGFWLEIECSHKNARIVKAHPEYFINSGDQYFVDFSKTEAREYIFDKICSLINRYGAEFIKFDFNADLIYDPSQSGFYNYFDGYLQMISDLKAKFPNMYMENCASGGMRLGLRDGRVFDSFWLSDNQSPYEGMRIYKDTLLRMPPQWIECWAVIRSVENFAPINASDDFSEKIISTDDATISNVVGVNMSYLKAFLSGCPIGISCDLNLLSEKVFYELKEFIAEFKKERDFWISANCRILTDTETMLVLQYSDPDLSNIKIVVVSQKSIQNNIRVYPVVKKDLTYLVDTTSVSGNELEEYGIDVPVHERYTAAFINLKQ